MPQKARLAGVAKKGEDFLRKKRPVPAGKKPRGNEKSGWGVADQTGETDCREGNRSLDTKGKGKNWLTCQGKGIDPAILKTRNLSQRESDKGRPFK